MDDLPTFPVGHAVWGLLGADDGFVPVGVEKEFRIEANMRAGYVTRELNGGVVSTRFGSTMI